MVVFWKDSLDFAKIIQGRADQPTEPNFIIPDVVGKQTKNANRPVKNVFLRSIKQV
jgi:hypothetical protein